MKNTKARGVLCLACCLIVLGMMGCGGAVKHDAINETHYLKYNFHYTTEKGKVQGSVAKYTSLPDHQIVPYESSVKVGPWGKGFILIDEKSGTEIEVLAKKKYLAGTSLPE